MLGKISSVLLIFALFHVLEGREDPERREPCQPSKTTLKGTMAPQGQICSGDLIFEDNFDTFDTGKWRRENTLSGGGNGEFQWYTTSDNNSFTTDGSLHIRPTFLVDIYGEDFLYSGTIDLGDGCTEDFSNGCQRTGSDSVILNPIMSGKLTTKDSFRFTYGVLETRARIPSGEWLWPAIWMLPINSVYGGWPASGEIDLVESRGNKNMWNDQGVNIGSQQVASTMHWGPNPNFNRYYLTHWEKNNDNGFDNDYHTYRVHWSADSLDYFVDDVQIGSVAPPAGGFWEFGSLYVSGLENPWTNSKMAPFDQEFYIIINLAIGATNGYFPDNVNYGDHPKPWANYLDRGVTDFWQGREAWEPTWNRWDADSRSNFVVDYVRVYAL